MPTSTALPPAATAGWRKRHPVAARVVLYGIGLALALLAFWLLSGREQQDREDHVAYLWSRLETLPVVLQADPYGPEALKVLDAEYADPSLPAALRARVERMRGVIARNCKDRAGVDAAYGRAREIDPAARQLSDLVLTRASADLDADREEAAELVLNSPAFDQSFEDFLRDQMKEMVFVYTGDLPDGEAYEGHLLAIEEVDNWSVVALSKSRISLIVDARVKVSVEVQYEDRDHARYDSEDKRWYGAEPASTDVEDNIEIQVLVEIERSTGQVRDGKVLTSDVDISGPSDWDL